MEEVQGAGKMTLAITIPEWAIHVAAVLAIITLSLDVYKLVIERKLRKAKG